MKGLTPGDKKMIVRGKAESYRHRAEEYRTTAQNYRDILADKKANNPLYQNDDFCRLAEVEFAQWIHAYEGMAQQMEWLASTHDEEEINQQFPQAAK